MQHTSQEKAPVQQFDYLRSKIFGSAPKPAEPSSQELSVKIRSMFPRFDAKSLLGKILAKIPNSPSPEEDLEIINDFCSILDDQDFMAFSQLPNAAPEPTSAKTLDTVSEIILELAPYSDIFTDPDTKIVCFWATSSLIETETFAGEVRQHEMKSDEAMRQLLAKSCRFGVSGQTIAALELTEIGYRMAYSYNGWKQVRTPCILFKRLAA